MQFRPRSGHFNQGSFQRKLSVKIKYAIFAFYFNHSFFKYLCGKTAKDDFTDRLSALVERVKMNAQWRHRYMTIEQEIKLQVEARTNEKVNEKINEKLNESKLQTAKKMLENNIPAEIIAKCTGLELSQVDKLKQV